MKFEVLTAKGFRLDLLIFGNYRCIFFPPEEILNFVQQLL